MKTELETGWDECAALPGIARESVHALLARVPAETPRFAHGFLAEAHPVFVTIHNRAGELRGCVGTLQAKFPSVAEETWRVARSAAFEDGRFRPVRLFELPDLNFEVSVLHGIELVESEQELDPGVYGVLVSTPDGRRGVLLPSLERVTSVSQQIAIARQKGGIDAGESVKLERFRVTKASEAVVHHA